MTSTEKLGWGLGLLFGATAIGVVGILLTATLIGAILGIPMILGAIPLSIWGLVWCYQGQFQRQEEAISRGIQEGIRRSKPPG